MQRPLSLEIDFEAMAAYVRYSHANVVFSRDAWDDGRVCADFDSSGDVVGIEIVGLGAEVTREAAVYAFQHFLAFPAHRFPSRGSGD